MTVIRSAALRGLRATVAELGGDVDRYAEVVGLPVAALDTDDMLIPITAFVDVLQYTAVKLDCPDLGLRVARRQDLSMLGLLALALQSCSTVNEFLTCTSRYLLVHSPIVALSLQDDPYRNRGVIALHYGTPIRESAHYQAVDLGLGFLHRNFAAVAGGKYGLRSVELPYQPTAPLDAYESFFEAPIRINQPAALLRIPRSLLKMPVNSGGNPHLRQLAEAFLAEQLPADTPRRLTPRVRTSIEQSLATLPPNVSTVARMLSIHPRTLQRRLAEECTTFAQILDDVRRRTARRYLTGSDMPLTQLAGLLGLSEQSALSRCCRRWWGVSPTAIRQGYAIADAT
ncbi:MAG: AraC family transcriptional regulator ligand-binding domain-containing protein [Mycobacterium sp.]